MNPQPNYYAIIPADVRYNANLTLLERFLYCEITALSNINGYCFANNEYFANLYNKSNETISRALSKLKKENHIEIIYETQGSKVINRKIYPLTQQRANDIIVNRKETTNDIFVNGEIKKILFAIDKKVKDNNITYKEIYNTITNIGKDSVFDDVLFNEFWEAYPKKQAKKSVFAKFKKLNPNQELFQKMMSMLETQKKSKQWQDIQFIPNPLTWINQERWNDELAIITDDRKISPDYGSKSKEDIGSF